MHLRLGEILVRSPKEAGSVIQKQDVSFTYCNRRPQSHIGHKTLYKY